MLVAKIALVVAGFAASAACREFPFNCLWKV